MRLVKFVITIIAAVPLSLRVAQAAGGGGVWAPRGTPRLKDGSGVQAGCSERPFDNGQGSRALGPAAVHSGPVTTHLLSAFSAELLEAAARLL